jgi:hypothetical protein
MTVDNFFTPGNKTDLVPEGDTARQAVDSLRGYAYQVLASALAWVDVGETERLYLEVAEDYAIIARDMLDAVQVKDTAASGTVTLNSVNIRDAIASYIDLATRNAGILVSLRYLTTSEIGVEKAVSDRPGGIAGLEYWRKAAASANVSPIRALLERDEFPAAVRDFSRTRDDTQLRRDLLQRIRWDCGRPDFATLRADLEERLIVVGRDRFGLSAPEAKRLADTLGFRVLGRTILKKQEERVLRRSELYELLGAAAEVAVPRTMLGALMSQLAGGVADSLSRAQGGSAALAASDPGWLIPSPTLPAPARFIPRMVVRDAALFALSNYGCAILTGASGLGKSHIARAAALSCAGGFLLVDFRDVDAAATRRRLDNVFGRVGGLDTPLLIFEDLNHLGNPTVARALGRVLEALRYRDRSALITCYSAPSTRPAAEAGLDPRAIVPCPYFSEEESEALVRLYGGETPLWGRLAHVAGASGHPQLTHAFVVGMSARGWPRAEVRETVVKGFTSGDIEAEKEAARRNLIAALPEHARALLFRLSLLIGRFDRMTALTLGQMLAPIAQVGDALDVLVGPWIEPLGRDQYRVSPLASGAGRSMLSPDEQQRLHESIASHMLKRSAIEASDIDAILMHAILGKCSWALMILAVGILTTPHDKLPLIVESVTFFKFLNLDNSFYPLAPSIASVVRLAQFKILDAAEERESAAAAAEAALRDVSSLESGELKTVSEVIVLFTVLSTMNVADYFESWVSWLQRLKDFMESGALDGELQSGLQNAARAGGFDPFSVFFSIGAGRLTSVARLETIIDALGKLKPSDRNVWLSPVSPEISDYSVFVNGPWAAQQKNKDFDAADAVDRYARIAEKTKDWTVTTLTLQAWIARAVLLDEYLSKGDAALAVLDEAAALYGDNPLLSRARAKVYWRRDEHPKALEILRGIADVMGRDNSVERAFALREASISAAKCGEWKQARTWLLEAQEAAAASQTDDMQVMATGLIADAAVAAMEMGDVATALTGFVSAVTALRRIDPEASLQAAYCHRVVRYAILWAQSVVDKAEMSIGGKPIVMLPGSCSNPNPPDAVRTSPLASLDMAWYMLAEIEAAVGVNAGIAAALDDKLTGGRIPFMEMEVRLRLVGRAVERCDAPVFAASLTPYVDATAYFTGLQKELRTNFDPRSLPRGDIPAADLSTEMSEQIATDALLAFGIQAVYARHQGAMSALRAELSKQLGADHVGHTLFDPPAGTPAQDLTRVVKEMLDKLDARVALHPREFWFIGLRFFEQHRQSGFGRLLIPSLTEWFKDGWRRILQNQAFLLVQPMRTVPPIRAALDIAGSGNAAMSALLLATVDAVRVPLGDEYASLLRAAADGP